MTVEYLVSESNKGRALIFDLDNTIYQETQFLFRAYKEISKSTTHYDPNIVYKFLVNVFKEQGREEIFDKLKRQFNLDAFTIENCLITLRNYSCDNCINTFPWFNKFLSHMRKDYIIKIITNGSLQQQQNKIKSIKFDWPKELIEVVYASIIGQKPDTASFYQLKDAKNFIDPLYVGDSLTDKIFCKNLNIEFYDAKKLFKFIDHD
jgi:putative hydrolase of the HAD superfamily